VTAEALGLGACPVGAFRDAEVIDVLELGDDSLPLYLIPVGERFEP
jgi:nitroreductase